MISFSEYQINNVRLIQQLIEHKVKSIIRLTVIEPEDELRLEFGPLLLETYSGIRLYIDVDRGRGNILLFDASNEHTNVSRKIDEFLYKSKIYPEDKTYSLINSFFSHPVCAVDLVSRPDEASLSFTMCGFRLSFHNGKFLYLGSYLTDLKLPELCILFPEEVENNLIHQPLTVKSE